MGHISKNVELRNVIGGVSLDIEVIRGRDKQKKYEVPLMSEDEKKDGAKVVTTDQKRSYLREWALAQSGGAAHRLPVIREARVAVSNHFGGGPGAGLGTDLIAQELRSIHTELQRSQVASVGQVGHVEASPQQLQRMNRLTQILALLKEEGIETITVDADGTLVELKRIRHS